MKKYALTILTVLLVMLVAVGLTSAGDQEPRSKHGPEEGKHTGDHGQAGNPGNPQRPAVNPAGKVIEDKGEPDPRPDPTPGPPDPTPPPPPPDPTPTPKPENGNGNGDGNGAEVTVSGCLACPITVTLVIQCDGSVALVQ